MLLMVCAMLILPGIDAIAKWLSSDLTPGQITWCRFAFQTLFMLPLALRIPGAPRPRDVLVHGARGALLAITTLVFFAALAHLPMADAIAIFFVEPLILTLLAAIVLGERVGIRRITAIIIGLIGATVVVRPNFAAFGWPALLPLLAATCFACYLLLTRRYAVHDDPARMQFLAGLFGLAFMSIALALGTLAAVDVLRPSWPTPVEWTLLALLGAIAAFGHLLVVHAFKRVPAVVLAPFQYMEIVGATLLGWLIFSDFPDPLTWLGIAIIVASGLYVFHREHVRTRRLTPSS